MLADHIVAGQEGNVIKLDGLRAVIYTRVSSDPRGLGRSVKEQEQDSRDFCLREGCSVVKVFSDNDKGASAFSSGKREYWLELILFLEGGNADLLVTWEASRAQRDLEVYLQLRKLCWENNIFWCYSGRVYDLSRTDDRFTTGLDALLSEREASVTRDRVLRAMESNAQNGHIHGPTLYGYVREYDSSGNFVKQVPHSEQSFIIKEIAKRVSSGEALHAVAKGLNDRNIPTARGAKLWSANAIKSMVRNPAYIGKRVHRGNISGDAVWPPLIEELVYYSCRQILDNPARKTKRDRAIKHMLSGLIRCGVCNAKIRSGHSRNRIIYTCVGTGHVEIKKEWAHQIVEAAVFKRLSEPAFFSVFQQGNSSEIAQLLSELEEKRSRLEGFYEEASKGRLSPAGLASVEQRLIAEINSIEQSMVASAVPSSRELILQLTEGDIQDRWESLSLLQKREVISILMDIILLPRVSGHAPRLFDPRRVKIVWKG